MVEGKAKDFDKYDLVEFYGETCPPCIQMKPLVEKLEKEEKVKILQLEVWNNKENAEILAGIDKGLCGGVPFFLNKKTGKFVCGAISYEGLKGWALGK